MTCKTPPQVPDHELLRPIGHGAYGEVWLARSVTGAYRAVKVVSRASFSRDRPFEREFEGILQFEPISRRHDSQVHILHVGRGEDHFYYVMELADDQATGGQILPDQYAPRTLKSDLVFRSRLPFEEVISIGISLATALQHLHEKGLVHRDVKPSNIIFVNGVPKLADIGLVTGIDSTRSFVGTEGFAAPEGAGTPRADIYSLGKVLYEIATGRDRQEFPELPTEIYDLPDREGLIELNAVIARACRHDPKDRYLSAAEMRADLEFLQSGKSLARLRRTERRLKFVQRAGAVITGVAAMVAAGWLWQARQTKLVSDLAEDRKRLATELARMVDSNREQLVRLRVANGIRTLDEGDPSAALVWFAEALPLVTNRPEDEAMHRIRIQQTLDQLPRLTRIFPHSSSVLVGTFSPDSKYVATGTMDGQVRVWSVAEAKELWPATTMPLPALQVRFTRDGRKLLVSSSARQNCAAQGRSPRNFTAVLDVLTGQPVSPVVEGNLSWGTFSPDDRWMVLADHEHTLRVHDLQEGGLVAELKGHSGDILMPSFSSNGTLIASASRDGTARLWQLPSGQPLGQPFVHSAPVARAILSDDGALLATSTEPLTHRGPCWVQLWNTATGEKIGTAINVPQAVNALFFNPGKPTTLFTAGRDALIRMWNCRNGSEQGPGLKLGADVAAWAFSPDGSRLLVGSDDHQARVFVTETRHLLTPPLRHTAWVLSTDFSGDGRYVLTTGNDDTARIWDTHARDPERHIAAEAALLPRRAVMHDKDYGRQPGSFPVFLQDGTVRLLDPATLQETDRLAHDWKKDPPDRCITASNGRQWAVFQWIPDYGGIPRVVVLWRKEGSNLLPFPLPHPMGVSTAEFSQDNLLLYTACQDRKVRVWRTSDGSLERTIPWPDDLGRPWSFSRNLRLLLTLHDNPKSFGVLELSTGRPLGSRVSVPVLTDQEFNPAGTRIATAGFDGFSRVYDIPPAKRPLPPMRNADSLSSIDWSRDGRRLLTAGTSPGVQIWDAASGKPIFSPLRTGSKSAEVARWSADDRFIVTRNDDGSVRVWDGRTGEAITPAFHHPGYVHFACVTGDDRLITGNEPNHLRSRQLRATVLPADVLSDYAKLLSGRYLSPEGALLDANASELFALCTSLQARMPEAFAPALDQR